MDKHQRPPSAARNLDRARGRHGAGRGLGGEDKPHLPRTRISSAGDLDHLKRQCRPAPTPFCPPRGRLPGLTASEAGRPVRQARRAGSGMLAVGDDLANHEHWAPTPGVPPTPPACWQLRVRPCRCPPSISVFRLELELEDGDM